MTFALLVFIIGFGTLPAAVFADASEDYATLSGSKALAVIPGTTDGHGVAHGQPNDLVASLAALKSCESGRTATQPPCEVRRLNDEQITGGAEIRAATPTRPHPLHLWKLTGSKADVYLAGSIHILKPSLYPLPDPYEQAFESADHLVLEVNVAGYNPVELQQKTMAYASLNDGKRIAEVLTEPTMTRLSEALSRYGLPITQVATVKPAFVMNQLLLLRLITLGYQPDYGMEQHFLKKIGARPILELETIDAQLALLFNQPMSLQRLMLADALDQHDEIEPLISGMVSAWLAGDDESFMEMFEQQAGDSVEVRRFTEQLIDERNIGMAQRISEYLNGEGTFFVLVGTAHLIGRKGIPALLSAAGIESVRLSSDTVIEPD